MSKIVLCVDDSATMQQVADITFRGTEFTYVAARSYDEGFDKAKSSKPTVVLVDAQMPGKSGYDLCLALKSNQGTADVPVVILIGNNAPYDAAKGVTVGADANLMKPWDTQTMLEKVTEVVTKAAGGVAKPGQAAAAAEKPAAAAAPAPAAAMAAVKNAPAAQQPPRSATIMGMPTIKMPAGTAPTVSATPAPAAAAAAAPVAPAASKTTVMAVPPVQPGGAAAPALRAPAPPPPGPSSQSPTSSIGVSSVMSNRAPMVSGTPTKRSVLVERMLTKMAAQLAAASGLEQGSPELLALLKLSAEVVERIVWEVVPDLAEQIIRENLHDLAAQRRS